MSDLPRTAAGRVLLAARFVTFPHEARNAVREAVIAIETEADRATVERIREAFLARIRFGVFDGDKDELATVVNAILDEVAA